MFNLKRKFTKLIEPTKDPQVIVAEIHNSFDTAGDKLLNDAKNILSGSYDIEKGERLKKIGFGSTKKAVEASIIINKKKEMEELAKLIGYYQMYYPNNKFITESKTKEICQKYGLLCAQSKYYISDIPEKNLTEIENFKLRQEDMVGDKLKICASVKDFNTENMQITDGYKLELNLPDPIVLQPVNGGYLIVSKWGLEAEDNSLANEKMN
jgi:hypothetical protein